MLTFAPGMRSTFPQDDYTPFGYLHTPHHTGIVPSGLLRSVEPLGFGLYRRGFSWYGMDALNGVNAYLSLLLPSLRVNGILLAETEDFVSHHVKLVSRYHSSNIMTYDFCIEGMSATLAWFSDKQDTLYVRVSLRNISDAPVRIHMDAAHAYGMNGKRWWGSDAITARYNAPQGTMIAKILAYGDIYVLGADLAPDSGIVARSHEELDAHRRKGVEISGFPAATAMPGPLYAALEWDIELPENTSKLFTIALCRGVNEKAALTTLSRALSESGRCLAACIEDDNTFSEQMPVLGEGWPDHWRRGMVYHYQTLRMNVYPSKGIFTHRWDGMQTANPRMVLGETCIDMLSMHYADLETALEVITTTFEDSPDVYVPCCREDGSVNMIGSDGSECATALMWGFPLKTIRTLLAESRNVAWLHALYPHLKQCVDWWRSNRTDVEGWYHCNNSWESGQDGSRRFVTGDGDGCAEGMNADHVRAVDLESTMAQTAQIMAEFASLIGKTDDEKAFREMHERGVERVRRMFFVDRYRDINALTGEPFMTDAHADPMLTMPLATGQATTEQIRMSEWILEEMVQTVDAHQFTPNGVGVFWPPILQTLTSSLSESGHPDRAAYVTAVLADTAWKRDDSRVSWPNRPIQGIPDRYHRCIPGNARENLSDDIPTSGTENYGWGCVSIALFHEHILGLRTSDLLSDSFTLQPVLPEILSGDTFAVKNVSLFGIRVDFCLKRKPEGLRIHINSPHAALVAYDKEGVFLAEGFELTFTLALGRSCTLRLAHGR